jgi:hypothetical protein
MRTVLCGLVVSACIVSAAMATPGDTWILPIADTNGSGFTTYSGVGYNGTDALGATGPDGVRRIIWKFDAANAIGPALPTGTELFSLEFYNPNIAVPAADNYQPVESQFGGSAGEVFPMDPGIPWAGAFGTNHQYVETDRTEATRGEWVPLGPGPHSPDSANYNAGANGSFMWLQPGSWLYVKWDFPFNVDRAWSALRLTQEVPEPATVGFLALASGVFLLRRRARA